MTSRHRGIGTPVVVAVVIAVVIVIGAIGYAVLAAQTGTPIGGTSTPSNATSSTSSFPPTSTSSTAPTSSTSVTCTQTGIHGSLQVRLVSDSGLPVQGANVTATILDYCESGDNQPNALGMTNASGYAPNLVGWTGSMTVSVTYAGAEYTFPAQTNGEIVATLSIPSGVAVERTMGCGGPPGCLLTTTTVTASSGLYVPPPVTTIIHYGCGISAASSTKASALVLVNTSKVSDVRVNVSVAPALTISAAGCSRTHTNTTTPTACGVMCGGEIGYTYAISDVWKLNFSLSSPVANGGYNLTIAAGSGLSDLFPGLSTQVYLNSQQITAWYSNPPCYGGQGIESGCIESGATSLTIELPAPVQGGAYQLVINSGEYLVP